jgi:hypothetical protein
MATFSSKNIIDELITGNGRLANHPEDAPDNPRAVKIIEYTNAWGAQAYGVVFEGERDPDRYERETWAVNKPRVIWRYTT